jgi:hypothetical protein
MRGQAETSFLSFLAKKEDGTAAVQRLAILNFLRTVPTASFSRTDLSKIFGYPIQSVCGRIGELKDDGLVIELPKRRCPHTGQLVKPIQAAPDLLTAPLH